MKVLIASGGSGGHIFPAISVARELETEGAEITFVASKRDLDKIMLHEAGFKKLYLTANPMPYKFGARSLVFLAKLLIDSVHTLAILARYRPDVVVGFGGYTSGAVVLLGKTFGTKTVIHEQNAVPGRTNKLLRKFVDKICVSFEETKKYFKSQKVVFTGNPLRETSLRDCKEEAIRKMNLDRGRMTILVIGGSQGAVSLNNLVARSVTLLPSSRKNNIQLVHIAGPSSVKELEDIYAENEIRGKVFGFIENINEAYSVCDLAISRSGAAAIFELAAFKKPMILIPYPNEKNNQRFNAMYFEEKGAAICRKEKDLGPEELRDMLVNLMDDAGKRKDLSENAARLSMVDGAKRLKREIMNIK